jgi:hypothetical protein
MIEGRHYQNAYVTRNIDKAIESFRKRSDVQDVMTIEIEQELWTPRGSGVAREKLAFIWINNLQYELIEPVSGLVHVYADELPDDDSMKFHHICMRVPDWDEFRARVEKAGHPIALEGQSGDALRFLYLDARDYVGHYLEYVWCTEERWAQMTPPSMR